MWSFSLFDTKNIYMYILILFAFMKMIQIFNSVPGIIISLLILLFIVFYIIWNKRKEPREIISHNSAKKIFYNFDDKEGKFKNHIFYIDLGIGQKNEYSDITLTNLMENHKGLIYNKFNYMDNSFSYLCCNDYFVYNKIKDLEKNVYDAWKITNTLNIFRTNKEIKKYFIEKFGWNIGDNEINYDLLHTYPLNHYSKINKNENFKEKYIHIDNQYYLDKETFTKYAMNTSDYCLTLGVKNGYDKLDIVMIYANKNKNDDNNNNNDNNKVREIVEKIEKQEIEIKEIRRELESLKNIENIENIEKIKNIENIENIKNIENTENKLEEKQEEK
jgi:hypothetical protein